MQTAMQPDGHLTTYRDSYIGILNACQGLFSLAIIIPACNEGQSCTGKTDDCFNPRQEHDVET